MTANVGTYANILEAPETLTIQGIQGRPDNYTVIYGGEVVAEGSFPPPSTITVASQVSGSQTCGSTLTKTPGSTPAVGDTLVITGAAGLDSSSLTVSGGNATWSGGVNTDLSGGYPQSAPFILIGIVHTAGAAAINLEMNGTGTYDATFWHIEGLASVGTVDVSVFNSNTVTPNGDGEIVITVLGSAAGSLGSTPTALSGSPLVLAPGHTGIYAAGYYVQPTEASTSTYGWVEGTGVNQYAVIVLTPAAGGTVLSLPPPNGVAWQPGYVYVQFDVPHTLGTGYPVPMAVNGVEVTNASTTITHTGGFAGVVDGMVVAGVGGSTTYNLVQSISGNNLVMSQAADIVAGPVSKTVYFAWTVDTVQITLIRPLASGVHLPQVSDLPPGPPANNAPDLNLHWFAAIGPERYTITNVYDPTSPNPNEGPNGNPGTYGLAGGIGQDIAGVASTLVDESTNGYFDPAWQDPARPRVPFANMPYDIGVEYSGGVIGPASWLANFKAGVTTVTGSGGIGPGSASGIIYFEGVNEPDNYPDSLTPAASGLEYFYFREAVKTGSSSAMAMGPAAVSAAPNGGATFADHVGDIQTFIQTVRANGGDVDAISVHNYNGFNGDFLVTDGWWDALITMLAAQPTSSQWPNGFWPTNPADRITIWVTELGLAEQVGTAPVVNDVYRLATWQANILLTSDKWGIPKERISPYYDAAMGFSTYMSWMEEPDGSLRAHVTVYRVFSEEVFGKAYDRALTFGAIGDNLYRAHVFNQSGTTTGAMVALVAQGMVSDTVTLSGVGSGPITYSDWQGNLSTADVDTAGNVTIPVDGIATYVRLPTAKASTVEVVSAGGITASSSNLAANTGPIQTAESATSTITLPNHVTAGDLLTLVSNNFDLGNITAVSGGGTWVKAVGVPFDIGGSGSVDMWYCLSATGGATTATITWSGSDNPISVLAEWPPCSALAHAASTTNSSGIPKTPSYTPGQAGDLFIGMVSVGGEITATPAGWTELGEFASFAAQHAGCQHFVNPSTSAVQGQWSPSASYSSGVMVFTPVTPFVSGAVATSGSSTANVELINDGTFQTGGYLPGPDYMFSSTTIPDNVVLTWSVAQTFNQVVLRQIAPWTDISGTGDSGTAGGAMLTGKLEYWNGTAWVGCPTVPQNHWDDAGNYSNSTATTATTQLTGVGHTTEAASPAWISWYDQNWVSNIQFAEPVTSTKLRLTVDTVGVGQLVTSTLEATYAKTPAINISELLVFDSTLGNVVSGLVTPGPGGDPSDAINGLSPGDIWDGGGVYVPAVTLGSSATISGNFSALATALSENSGVTFYAYTVTPIQSEVSNPAQLPMNTLPVTYNTSTGQNNMTSVVSATSSHVVLSAAPTNPGTTSMLFSPLYQTSINNAGKGGGVAIQTGGVTVQNAAIISTDYVQKVSGNPNAPTTLTVSTSAPWRLTYATTLPLTLPATWPTNPQVGQVVSGTGITSATVQSVNASTSGGVFTQIITLTGTISSLTATANYTFDNCGNNTNPALMIINSTPDPTFGPVTLQNLVLLGVYPCDEGLYTQMVGGSSVDLRGADGVFVNEVASFGPFGDAITPANSSAAGTANVQVGDAAAGTGMTSWNAGRCGIGGLQVFDNTFFSGQWFAAPTFDNISVYNSQYPDIDGESDIGDVGMGELTLNNFYTSGGGVHFIEYIYGDITFNNATLNGNIWSHSKTNGINGDAFVITFNDSTLNLPWTGHGVYGNGALYILGSYVEFNGCTFNRFGTEPGSGQLPLWYVNLQSADVTGGNVNGFVACIGHAWTVVDATGPYTVTMSALPTDTNGDPVAVFSTVFNGTINGYAAVTNITGTGPYTLTIVPQGTSTITTLGNASAVFGTSRASSWFATGADFPVNRTDLFDPSGGVVNIVTSDTGETVYLSYTGVDVPSGSGNLLDCIYLPTYTDPTGTLQTSGDGCFANGQAVHIPGANVGGSLTFDSACVFTEYGGSYFPGFGGTSGGLQADGLSEVNFGSAPSGGAFTAVGTLSGTGTVVLTGSRPAFYGAIAFGGGSLTQARVQSGSLGASGRLSGTGIVTDPAALTATATLSGTGTVTTTVQGSGVVTATGTLSGTGTSQGGRPAPAYGGLAWGDVAYGGAELSTLTGSGSLAGSASLSGSGTIPTTAGSGSLAGSASLSGSGTIPPMVGSGALAGHGSLSGAGMVPKVGSGALAGHGSLSGSGTIIRVYTGTGALVAHGALSATGVAVLAGTGQVTGSAVLTGTGQIGTGATGSLSGTGSLLGSATVTLPGTEALSGSASLSGSGSTTVTNNGTGTLAGTGSLSGTGVVTTAGTGTVAATGTLSGLGIPVTTGTGSLIAAGSLSASGTVLRSGSGTLAGLGIISGVSTVVSVYSGSGHLNGAASLSGSGATTLPGSGTLSGLAVFAGAGSTTIVNNGVGTFDASGVLSGAGTVVIVATNHGICVITDSARYTVVITDSLRFGASVSDAPRYALSVSDSN